MKLTARLAGLGLATLMATSAAQADTIRLSIGAGHPASAIWVASVQDFFTAEVSKRVAETTDHEIVWTHGYGASICKLDECLETVESGLLDIAQVGVAFEPSKLRAHNFSYFVPFGTPDPKMAAEAARAVYEEVPELSEILENKYNQVFVGVSVVGNYGLQTTFSWEKFEDLRGHKIAAAGPNIPWLEGSGVVPVQGTLNEAYTGLQTGVYEGWVMYPDAVVSFRLYEVGKNFADVRFGSIAFPILTMNAARFRSLPEEVQKIILEVGAEWGRENAEIVDKYQAEAFTTMEKAGVHFVDVSDETRKAWADSLPNLPKQRFDEIEASGAAGAAEAIYVYIDKLKELGHEFPRDWSTER